MMIELESWARPFFNVVVQVMNDEAGPLHLDYIPPAEVAHSLEGDGLYVGEELHKKLKDAMAAAGYMTSYSDEIDVAYDASQEDPRRGLMHTVAEDEPDTHIWMFYDHN